MSTLNDDDLAEYVAAVWAKRDRAASIRAAFAERRTAGLIARHAAKLARTPNATRRFTCHGGGKLTMSFEAPGCSFEGSATAPPASPLSRATGWPSTYEEGATSVCGGIGSKPATR